MVAGIRSLLAEVSFALLGADEVSVIIEGFAEWFARNHPELSPMDPDSWHVVAMAVLLLNGDLHRRTLGGGRRMRVAEFVKNVQSSSEVGAAIPASLLQQAYAEVKASELVQAPAAPPSTQPSSAVTTRGGAAGAALLRAMSPSVSAADRAEAVVAVESVDPADLNAASTSIGIFDVCEISRSSRRRAGCCPCRTLGAKPWRRPWWPATIELIGPLMLLKDGHGVHRGIKRIVLLRNTYATAPFPTVGTSPSRCPCSSQFFGVTGSTGGTHAAGCILGFTGCLANAALHIPL